MPMHTAIARPQFGSLDHLRRSSGSVMENVAERQGRFLRLKARQAVDKVKEKGPAAKEVGIRSLEIGGTAVAWGMAHAYFDPDKLMLGPLPLDLLVGVGAHLVGLFGPEAAASHLHAVGDGSVAAFGFSLGRGFGRKLRQARGLPPRVDTTLLSGEASTGGGALSDEELARLARRG